VARHASRAVHRDLLDPSHPMARLLAAAGEAALQPDADKDRIVPVGVPPTTVGSGPAPAARALDSAHEEDGRPAPTHGPDQTSGVRPVHVAEPEPEPDEEQPATLEALAARFGHQRDRPPKGGAPSAPAADRSRQARKQQAAILARLREEASRALQS
jgi:hypothetical protein